jgi:dihydroorotate dehydrogenase
MEEKKIEYFNDETKELWEKNGNFSAKIGEITISSPNEKELREFLSQFE